MGSREPSSANPAQIRRILAAAAEAAGVAAAAQTSADSAATDAATAQANAITAQTDAAAAQVSADVAGTDALEAKVMASMAFEGATLKNGILTTSVSAGSITISIKNVAGNNPVAADGVVVVFTSQAGVRTTIPVISAKSITIPSGATLGANASVGIRIWVVALLLNSNSDFVLGVVNRLSENSTFTFLKAYMVPDHYIYGNQLSIGVVDASSSSTGVIYTDSASGGSGRPMRILGSLLFEGGLTPGTWVNPNSILLAGRGAKGPGDVVQTGVWCQSTKSTITITTALPIDNTRPLFSTTEYGSWTNIDFTPDSGTNYIEVEFSGYVSAPTGTTTADYVGVGVNIANSDMSAMHIDRSIGADIPQLLVLHAALRAPVGGVNQNNLQISFMCTHTGTLAVNGTNAVGSLFGGAGKALYKVSEIVG